jgi:hypothetical protein
MSTNITLSCTVESDDDTGMAVALMARCMSDVLRGTSTTTSISLSVFGDEFVADADAEADEEDEEVGRRLPIGAQNPDGVALAYVHPIEEEGRR